MPRGIYKLKGREAVFTPEQRAARLRDDPPLCVCGCNRPVGWDAGRCRWRRFASVACYRQPSPHRSKEWLQEMYVKRGISAPVLAAQTGVTRSAIFKQLRKHGIPRRSPSESHKGLQRGKDNPAWKGGVTPERQRLYKTPEWKETLLAVWTRDGFRCQRCGAEKTGKRSLHAHHIQPFATAPQLRFEPTNLVTLCSRCHLWVHSRANTERQFIA